MSKNEIIKKVIHLLMKNLFKGWIDCVIHKFLIVLF